MEIKRSALVPHSVEGMFDLIEHAEDYPRFVPWCTQAAILERSDDWVAARLEFSYMKIRFGFATRNAKRRPEWLRVRLVEGPFRQFQGDWRLTRLGHLGCKVEFDLTCEVADGLLGRVATPAIEFISRAMLEAFVRRAEETLPIESAPAATGPALSPRPASSTHDVFPSL